MIQLERLQRAAFRVAVVGAVLGFLTSAGCVSLPGIPRGALAFFHSFLFVLGAIAGFAAVRRGEEIDRNRWKTVEEPLLTSGERDWAHKHAERSRRFSATAFFAAPLMLGYWLAYQVEGEGRALAAQLLPVTAVLGSTVGWIVARSRHEKPD